MKNTVINNLRIIAGDILISWALSLYPAGFEKKSLACFLSSHYKLMLGCKKGGQNDEN